MTDPDLTLAELAASSGLEPRTIRSWVAQGLLPGPLSRGPAAKYPADALERVRAVRAMRELLGMSLSAIRQELLVATPEQVGAYAAKAVGLASELAEAPPPGAPRSSALDYLRALRAEAPPAPVADMAAPALPSAAPPAPSATSGFEALESRLAGRTAKPAARKARAEEWLRIPVTPDVELAVRGRLDAEQRTRLERCADLIRDILLGRTP
jgi:DNA-binding transcriptional MerR regulator